MSSDRIRKDRRYDESGNPVERKPSKEKPSFEGGWGGGGSYRPVPSAPVRRYGEDNG